MEMANSIIKQIIGSLIMNSFEEFKPEVSLWPVLLVCVEYLIMYDPYFMNNMGPTNEISLALCEATKTASIIDDLAATNYPYDILNHWRGIICADFERNNPDFQPLTNSINSTQVVKVMNQIGTEFSSLSIKIFN